MLIVAWETTAACNLKCSYCRAFASEAPDYNELGTKEAKAFIKSIASLQPMLILSGGEPLLRPDIFQLARLCHIPGPTCLPGQQWNIDYTRGRASDKSFRHISG